ncbi:MAG TPA: VWA domain-containing protein [Vicinamibacterales bacterium]|nr:VWA domain-containing protein [Vicinamibacterales bacterium]
MTTQAPGGAIPASSRLIRAGLEGKGFALTPAGLYGDLLMKGLLWTIGLVLAAAVAIGAQSQEGTLFRSGVDFVSVTATVTNDNGRFVSGLRRQDFTVYDDGVVQDVSHFSSERVPVSLGILLDVSGSMSVEKLATARRAIERLIFDLLEPDDELFFMQFATRAELVERWTTDRERIRRALRRMDASDGTALYDAVAAAIPTASEGRHRKKALLVISDGNDTSSTMNVPLLRQRILDSDVLVYALGVDSTARTDTRVPIVLPQIQFPTPFPRPGGFPPQQPRFPPPIVGGGSSTWPSSPGERVNADVLRQITDDTGGRTEIVRGFKGLDDATARIADELSKQYFLGYTSSVPRDGRWHSIRVTVRKGRVNVRARRGYFAS